MTTRHFLRNDDGNKLFFKTTNGNSNKLYFLMYIQKKIVIFLYKFFFNFISCF